MPSAKRLLLSDQPAVYHVMSRTAFGSHVFGPKEKEVFVSLLRQQAEFAGVEVLTFCVMENHFHLLVRVTPQHSLSDAAILSRYRKYYSRQEQPRSVTPPNALEALLKANSRDAKEARERVLARMGNLSAFVRELKQRFSIWFNQQHARRGTIWASRFKSLLVENQRESRCRVAAYIDLNPIRAGIVKDPKDYRWCGYGAAVAGVHEARSGLYELLKEETPSKRLADYRQILFGLGSRPKTTEPDSHCRIPDSDADLVRAAKGRLPLHELLRLKIRYFSDGLAFGSHAFLHQLYASHRPLFGPRRAKISKALPGDCWNGLEVVRDLQKSPFAHSKASKEGARPVTS